MPQPTKPKTPSPEPATRAAAQPAPPEQDTPHLSPSGGTPAAAPQDVIVYRKKKSKKKRKYTRGLRDVQRMQRGMVRGVDRIVDAAAAGLTEFRKQSNRSSRRRRDGAILDALDNWSRAVGETVRKSANAPYDFTKMIGSRRIGRQVRAVSRLVMMR